MTQTYKTLAVAQTQTNVFWEHTVAIAMRRVKTSMEPLVASVRTGFRGNGLTCQGEWDRGIYSPTTQRLYLNKKLAGSEEQKLISEHQKKDGKGMVEKRFALSRASLRGFSQGLKLLRG